MSKLAFMTEARRLSYLARPYISMVYSRRHNMSLPGTLAYDGMENRVERARHGD